VEKEITARRKKAPPTPLLAPPPIVQDPSGGNYAVSHMKRTDLFFSHSLSLSLISKKKLLLKVA